MSKKPTKSQKKQQQDDSTSKIFSFYRKKCDNNGVQPHNLLKDKILSTIESGVKFQQIHVWEQLGPVQVRCLMEGLFDLDYKYLKEIKIWKAKIGDEGVRGICKYITRSNTIEVLDILDNQITSLGCEFLGKALSSPDCRIQKLKLDDNPIGTEGLKHLTVGLAKNPVIHKLSFKYCNIDKEGAKFIQQILANIRSKVRILKLQGNPLGNEGAYQVLRAINISGEVLEKINIADIKMDLVDYKDPRVKSQPVKPSPKKKQNKIPDLFAPLEEKEVQPAEEEIKVEKRIPLSLIEHPAAQDNSFVTLEDKIVHELEHILKTNLIISNYNINFNPMSSHVGRLIVDLVQFNKRIMEIELPNSVSYDLRDQLDTILRKRNKKGLGRSPSKKKKKK